MIVRSVAAVIILVSLAAAQIPSGYVSYWKFDNDLTDENGSNNGTMSGGDAVYENGVYGNGIRLNSGDLSVNVGTDASLDFSGSFSIGGWVLPYAQSGYQKVVSKSTWNSGFYIQQSSTWPGKWQFAFQGKENVTGVDPVKDNLNKWVHLVAVYDGSTMYLYSDGVEVSSAASAGMTQSTAALHFGKVNAVLDEMIYYSRALSGTEVADLMSATRDTTPPVVSNLAAVQVPGYSALVTFDTDQTAYGTVEYTRDSVIAQYDKKTAKTEHSTLINGLGVAETWYYRVHAVNLQGYGSYTEWETLNVVMNAPDQKFSLHNSASSRPVSGSLVWPSAVGDADVCVYPDDKKAAACVTIDDNSALWDNPSWWIAWGEKFDQKYTWFVNTGGIDGGSAQAGTWDLFRDLYSRGHAVQSHSHTHGSKTAHENGTLNWMEDYGKCRAWVEENIPGNFCIANAYPGGAFENDADTAAMYFASSRGTRATANGAGRFNYRDTRASSTRSQDMVTGTLTSRGWTAFIIHAVQTADSTNVRGFLEFLHSHQESLWVGTYLDLLKYNVSYHTHELNVTGVTDSAISFTLADSMLDTIYNSPLTVKVRIENTWDTCIAMQGQNAVECTIVENDNNKYALVKAVPDRGEVVLSTDGQTTDIKALANIRTSEHSNGEQSRLFRLNGEMVPAGMKPGPGVYMIFDGISFSKKVIVR